jgi:hypothetical protein
MTIGRSSVPQDALTRSVDPALLITDEYSTCPNNYEQSWVATQLLGPFILALIIVGYSLPAFRGPPGATILSTVYLNPIFMRTLRHLLSNLSWPRYVTISSNSSPRSDR